LDEQGNFIPRPPSRLEPAEPREPPEPSAEPAPEPQTDKIAREYPIPGKPYVIHKGDSIASITKAANVFGQLVTIREIMKANPGLDPTRLLVGQRIMIPGGEADGNNAPAPDGSTPAPGAESAPDAPGVPLPP
jgi:LysM repeat protein